MVSFVWTEELLIDEALKYQSRSEFRNLSRNAYAAAQRRGILQDICEHMLDGRTIWSYEALTHEANKYKRRIDFISGSYKAYQSALYLGILDRICSHMTPAFVWTSDMLMLEAAKYQTRIEFTSNSSGAFNAGKKLKILHQMCKHMKRGRGNYNPEKSGSFYVVYIGDVALGFGISNQVEQRLKQHKRTCSRSGLSFSVKSVLNFRDGFAARDLETLIKEVVPIYNTGVTGFVREAVHVRDAELLYTTIGTFTKNLTTN